MKKGFTLVELAIVMIIIGLLIGGILKGTEMIENAKVSATLSQVQAYQAAIYTFQDTYSAMPGDMRNALDRIPGCVAATNCLNGSGNSLVENGVGTTDPVWDAPIGTNANWVETVQFWKHLVLADLITGVTTDSATAPADLAWGETHPSAKVGGGFEFYFDPFIGVAGNAGTSGHVLRLSNSGITAGATIGAAGTAPLSGLRASQMDRKVDDGAPSTGTVQANYGVANDGCKTGNEYDSQERRKSCVLFFLING